MIMTNFSENKKCKLCPRGCNVSRNERAGFCGVNDKIKVARASLHMWEEPPVSGARGSGTIFFSGCSLGCVYCQNIEISRGTKGKEITPEELQQICFDLKRAGAHNINLVTPSHFAPLIREALLPIKEELAIPIVCNTGGYDTSGILEYFEGVVDVYLPDFKYGLSDCAQRLSRAQDYPEVALEAIKMMCRQVGKPQFDEDGLIKKGVIVRHLCLPGERKNSIRAMEILGENFKSDEICLSVMRQYTPIAGMTGALSRTITTFEYESTVKVAEKYGFQGYYQSAESASDAFIPDFDLRGI